jgi:hypothetical protein
MKSPLEVVCPACKAAITAKCTVRGPGGFGMKFTDTFCPERVEKAAQG